MTLKGCTTLTAPYTKADFSPFTLKGAVFGGISSPVTGFLMGKDVERPPDL